jgi:hypothetical protein
MGSEPDQEGIAPSFTPDRCLGTVPGKDADLVVKGKDFLHHRIHELLPVATGEIHPPDRSREELVTGEEDTFIR